MKIKQVKIKQGEMQQEEMQQGKIKCECGSVVSKYNLPRHRKTQKHEDLIN